jgi:hypothetical protein
MALIRLACRALLAREDFALNGPPDILAVSNGCNGEHRN